VANGQELKKYVLNLEHKPSVICVQESWLKPNLQFAVPGYKSVRKDRVVKQGGWVVTFIKEGTIYRELYGSKIMPNVFELKKLVELQ